MIDTHAHLFWESYTDDLDQVLARAKAAGIEKVIVPGTNVENSLAAIELAKKYPGVIYPAIGIHPEDVPGADVTQVRRLIEEHQELVVAVGEIGIDLYTEDGQKTLDAQKKLFKAQCELALEMDLPVIIHTRNSFAETWEVLSSLATMPRGQFHCFSVDEAALTQVLAAGFYVSFCGNIAWSKRVAKLVPLVPLDKLLLETDSPFMDPGKRNEPANVKVLAELVAQIRETTIEVVAEATASNTQTLYRL